MSHPNDLAQTSTPRALAILLLSLLLTSLVSAQPIPTDPQLAITQRDAIIAQQLPALRDDSEALRRAIQQTVEYQQRMLDDPALADHWARPIWLTDLAEKLLFTTLPTIYLAGDFTLVGYPNDPQRLATHAIATAALQSLDRAQSEYQRLLPLLPKRDYFVTDLVNTGHWDQLNQCAALNIPYARAWALVYLMSADNSLDQQSRLIARAAADLVRVRQHAADYALDSDTQARLDLLTAELALRIRETDRALTVLTNAASHTDAQPITRLLVMLMRAKSLQQANRPNEAQALLEQLRQSDLLTNTTVNPLCYVLIADRTFALSYQQAMAATDQTTRADLLNQAFEVYSTLLGGTQLGHWQPAVARYVEQRYESQLPADLPQQQRPAPVLLAAAKHTFDQAEQLRNDHRDDEARRQYQQAADALEMVVGRSPSGSATQADAMFYQALSQLRLNQGGAALQILVDLAQQYPQSPRGEQAIRLATANLAPALFDAHPHNTQLRQLMDRMYSILLHQYATLDLAHAAVYDYAAFLRRTERYADAVNAYDRIDNTRPDYTQAQFERLICLGAIWQQTPASQRIDLANAIVSDVDRLTSAPDDPQSSNYAASALVLKAMIVNETLNDPTRAQQLMEEIRRQYGDLPGVEPRLTALNIRIHLKQHHYDLVEQELREYAKQDPDKAGPLAVEVINSIQGNVDLAPSAIRLADGIVIPWARSQTQLTDQQRLAYQIMPAQSMLAAGQYAQATDRYNALVQQFGKAAEDNLDVIMGRAEAAYQVRQFDESAAMFNRIIRWAQQNNRRDSTYWQAVLRVCQIQDAQAGELGDAGIARAIDRLQRESPDLGGEPYRSQLLELRDEHAPQ